MCITLSSTYIINKKHSNFSSSMKIKVKGDNIETIYNVIPYKSKVIHVENDILNFLLIRKN